MLSHSIYSKITIQKVFIRLVPEAGHDPETSEEVVWDAELAEGVDEHHPAQDEQEAGVGDAGVNVDKLFVVVAPDQQTREFVPDKHFKPGLIF